MMFYNIFLLKILRSFPKSFTFGEGCIVTQGLVAFLYNCFLQLSYSFNASEIYQQLNTILQIGLISVLVLIIATFYVPPLRHWMLFYPTLTIMCTGLCLAPIDNKYAFTILWNFLFKDLERSLVVGAYVGLLTMAVLTVLWQIRKNQKSSTAIRKIFHILMVMVYVPGLLYQCTLLYVASVLILAFLSVLELARIIKLYPVADILEVSVTAFVDEKDAGRTALTPLYLLVGCSLHLTRYALACDCGKWRCRVTHESIKVTSPEVLLEIHCCILSSHVDSQLTMRFN